MVNKSNPNSMNLFKNIMYKICLPKEAERVLISTKLSKTKVKRVININ